MRDRVFVGCKTQRRDPGGVRAHLEESLGLLQCDVFDLYQMHAVTDLAELDARAGAIEAILAARDEGLCRFVGITGHDLTAPAAHAEALRRYDLDTVMFPVNPRLWADGHYRRDAEALLEEAAGRDVGVMVIKAAAARPWGQRPHTAGTWYEPYTTAAGGGPGRALRPVGPRGPRLLHAGGHRGPRSGPRRRRAVHRDGRGRTPGRFARRGERAAHLPHADRLRGPGMLLLSGHPELDHHDTGGRHPERPGRIPAALGGIDDAGLRDAVVELAPRRASTEELVRVHPERYLDLVEEFCRSGGGRSIPTPSWGQGRGTRRWWPPAACWPPSTAWPRAGATPPSWPPGHRDTTPWPSSRWVSA